MLLFIFYVAQQFIYQFIFGEVRELIFVLSCSDIRENFARSLSMFVPFLSQTSLQLAARLETFGKEYFSMFDGQQSKAIGDGGDNVMGMDVSALELHDPMVHSRAGLYIFLNSLVSIQSEK